MTDAIDRETIVNVLNPFSYQIAEDHGTNTRIMIYVDIETKDVSFGVASEDFLEVCETIDRAVVVFNQMVGAQREILDSSATQRIRKEDVERYLKNAVG